METDYSKLTEITVKTQEELDQIPKDFKGTVYIEFGTNFSPAIIRERFGYRVVAQENSSVVARENSSVEAWGNNSVEAWGNSSVVARGNSSVVARENSSVEAWGNSSVEARGNSSVVARENSSVEARENSSVEAWGNSSVEAWGNTQVVDCLMGAKGRIKISGNARIVHNPKNVHEYMDFYGLPHTKKYGTFYKAVRKVDGKYISDYDCNFEYEVGKTAKSEYLDTDVEENCGRGIHMAYLQWVLDFGEDWDDLAILEVKAKLEDVIVPLNTGKVRVDKVTVIREVPLEECGLYGKILANRRKNNVKN